MQHYIRATRPERPIAERLELPLIHLMAESDYVTTAFVSPEQDGDGRTCSTTWFDLYRIEDGKITEHWDPMLKSDAPSTQTTSASPDGSNAVVTISLGFAAHGD